MTKNSEVAVSQQESKLLREQDYEGRFISPASDIYETPDAYVVTMDMPGASKDTIQISMDNATLIVRAHVEPHHKENATMLYNEIPGIGYYRAFNLGHGVSGDNVDAHFEHGVLVMKLFKKEEVKPREIKIK